MRWTEKQRRIAEVILAHRADTEAGYDFKAVMEALSSEEPVSKSQISDTRGKPSCRKKRLHKIYITGLLTRLRSRFEDIEYSRAVHNSAPDYRKAKR